MASGYCSGRSSSGLYPLEGCSTSRGFMDPMKFILALHAPWLKIVLFTFYNPIQVLKSQQVTFHIFTAHYLSLFMNKFLGINPATLQKLKSGLLICWT